MVHSCTTIVYSPNLKTRLVLKPLVYGYLDLIVVERTPCSTQPEICGERPASRRRRNKREARGRPRTTPAFVDDFFQLLLDVRQTHANERVRVVPLAQRFSPLA